MVLRQRRSRCSGMLGAIVDFSRTIPEPMRSNQDTELPVRFREAETLPGLRVKSQAVQR